MHLERMWTFFNLAFNKALNQQFSVFTIRQLLEGILAFGTIWNGSLVVGVSRDREDSIYMGGSSV